MYKNNRIMGLIPARGGSKGLKRKNILPLIGSPLVCWTIKQALKSKYLDAVIVSTDDTDIADISRSCGAGVPFLRPKRLSGDTAKTIDVIFHALNFFKKQGDAFDYLALLEPTSPLRKAGDIDASIRGLIDKAKVADSLVSLGKIALEHPIIAKKVSKEGFVKPFIKNISLFQRRQEMPAAYFPYGVIYLSKVRALEKYKTFYQKRAIGYLIERWQNYEVDDLYDFMCIETIARNRRIKLK